MITPELRGHTDLEREVCIYLSSPRSINHPKLDEFSRYAEDAELTSNVAG